MKHLNPEKPFAVNLYGSDPANHEQNDDCWTGVDVATLEEAQAIFANPEDHFRAVDLNADTAYIAIVQTEDVSPYKVKHHVIEKKVNPNYDAAENARREAEHDALCRSEAAHQAGMGFGCDGYNDFMGC